MRERLARILRRASEHVRHGGDWPQYFVRVATQYADATKIIYSAKFDAPPWSDELLARVSDLLLEPQDVDISVYASRTPERFDAAHALAVLASSISSDDFNAEARAKYLKKLQDAGSTSTQSPRRKGEKGEVKDDFARKVVSLIIPRSLLADGSIQATPSNNLNFAPADHLHHDVVPTSVKDVARALLDGIRTDDVVYTLIRVSEYRTQAALALSWCVEHYGDLSTAGSIADWRGGAMLSAREQLERLRLIAGDRGLQSRVELSL